MAAVVKGLSEGKKRASKDKANLIKLFVRADALRVRWRNIGRKNGGNRERGS